MSIPTDTTRRTLIVSTAATALLAACGGGGGDDGGSAGSGVSGSGTSGTSGSNTGSTGGLDPNLTVVSLTSAIGNQAVAFVADAKTFPLTARDANGNPVAGARITWTSSNPAVATVDGSGNVKAVAAGTTTVRATAGSASQSTALEVRALPTEIAELSAAFPYVAGSTVVGGLVVRSDISPKFAADRLANVEKAWQYMTAFYGGAPSVMDFNYSYDANILKNHVVRIAKASMYANDHFVYDLEMPAKAPVAFVASDPAIRLSAHFETQQHELGEWFLVGAQPTTLDYAAWLYEGLGLYFDSGSFTSATTFAYTSPRPELLQVYRASGANVSVSAIFDLTYTELTTSTSRSYAGCGILVGFLMQQSASFPTPNPNLIRNVIAQMRSGAITTRPQLEAYILANTGYATLAALEAACRTWVQSL